MPASSRRINYSLRPAKCIERKMICEALQRLSVFRRPESYEYVGFGSYYFTDFSLFHRVLNIQHMTSIEQNGNGQARFEFNKPFKCIEMKFGQSTHVLPTLNWDVHTIVWLDYDGPICADVLADISCVCTNAPPESILIVTVNAHPEPFDPQAVSGPLNRLVENLGRDKVPSQLRSSDLRGWNLAKSLRRIISDEIDGAISARNGIRHKSQAISYQQLFNFNYKDDAQMLTVGGVIFDNGILDRVDGAFSGLPFIRKGEDPCLIDPPKLTLKEIRYLNTLLPSEGLDGAETHAIPDSDINKYNQLYRYFPTYTEVEM